MPFKFNLRRYNVARHFHPKQDVMWLIDRMADLRLNVLHLHLTDDSGWRVEISKYPALTFVGAWRGHGLAVREIVEHAVGLQRVYKLKFSLPIA